MQHDSTLINWSGQDKSYVTLYPMIKETQAGAAIVYPAYQPTRPSPLSYGPYSPPLIASPAAVPSNIVPPVPNFTNGYVSPNVSHQPQPHRVVIPNQPPLVATPSLTTITPRFKVFLLISGVLYLLWCFVLLGLEIYITVETYWTFYRNIWTTGFIIAAGVCMLTVPRGMPRAASTAIRPLAVALVFSLLGIILSTINYLAGTKCDQQYYGYTYSCESPLIDILKLSNIGIYVAITIHTLINMLVCSYAREETSLPSIPLASAN